MKKFNNTLEGTDCGDAGLPAPCRDVAKREDHPSHRSKDTEQRRYGDSVPDAWRHDRAKSTCATQRLLEGRAQMRRTAVAAALAATLLAACPATAQEKLNAVASFSILGDLVKNVGGDRLAVDTLVGSNGNSHTYSPSPAGARKVAAANIVFVNGLGFEGWLERLIKAAGAKAPLSSRPKASAHSSAPAIMVTAG